MSEASTQESPSKAVLKAASLVHDVFLWSRGNQEVDSYIGTFLGLNYGHLIDLELLPEIKILATRAAANTRAKHHYRPIPLSLATSYAEKMVPPIIDSIEQAVKSDFEHLVPQELGSRLLDADYSWLPSVRAAVNMELLSQNKPPKPVLDKPYVSNIIKYGFLGKSTGQHVEFDDMFRAAAHQLLESCAETNASGNLARDKIKVVKLGHLADNPGDLAMLQDMAPQI